MANVLKKAVSQLIDKLSTPSHVVAIRAWQPATLYEVDVHLPTTAMEKWTTIQRLKCKVAEFEYRDYTPATWNAEERICTLYIEAGHDGAGSRWVQRLKKGDKIPLGVAHAAQLPTREGKILCLGDGTAIGHFLGMKQLTNRKRFPMEVVIILPEIYQLPSSLVANNPEFEFIFNPHGNSLETLEQWAVSKELSAYTSVYLAGHTPLVKSLRKKLKAIPDVRATFQAHGFWS